MFDSHTNLAGILWHGAESHPHSAAVIERDRTIDFASLRTRAAAVARHVADAGIEPGQRVAIFIERGAEAAAALFGVHAAGGVAVIVNERYRPRQIEYVLQHSGAGVMLATRDMLDRLHRDVETDARLIDPADIPQTADFTPVRRISPDVAQIMYTSGSTGMPKGVIYSNGALRAGIAAVSGYLGLRADDRVASLLPFSSVYGLNQLVTAVATGACIVVEHAVVAHQIVVGLASHDTTVLAAVPPLWIQLLAVPEFEQGALRGLRIAQNAGGHLPAEVVRRLRTVLPDTRFFLQYGMTETFRGTFLPPEEIDARPDCMGRAMPDTDILVLDESDRPAPVGEPGELVHRGPTIALGYWNDPEATRRTFRPNPLRPTGTPDTERVVYSGDIVRRDADGYLYFVSRRDRMIKTMGFRVGPDEVADAVYASGAVSEVVIDAQPDSERGERIIAYVVLRDEGSLDHVRRFCRAELPAYAQPAEYRPCSEIPRLPSGKYDIPALRALPQTPTS